MGEDEPEDPCEWLQLQSHLDEVHYITFSDL